MTHISLTACVEPAEPFCRNTLVCAPKEYETRRHHESAMKQVSLAVPERPGEERRVSRARRGSRRYRSNGEPDAAAAGLTETVAATTSGVTAGIDEQGDSTHEFH